MTELSGKVALVTGASRGIGLAIADCLERAGARVVRLARSLAPGTTPTRTDIPCDVTDAAAVERAVGELVAAGWVPDIVVNNAGTFLLKALDETTSEEFENQLAVNLVGPFHVLRALLPHLARRNDAHVVTIGSVADHRPYAGNAAYGASKYGVRGLHEVLVEELRGQGIRTTLVSPGPTDTRLWDPVESEHRADLPPRETMLSPEDVADAVLYVVTRPPRVSVEWIRLMPAS